jgi:hypothetical protein
LHLALLALFLSPFSLQSNPSSCDINLSKSNAHQLLYDSGYLTYIALVSTCFPFWHPCQHFLVFIGTSLASPWLWAKPSLILSHLLLAICLVVSRTFFFCICICIAYQCSHCLA